MVTLMFSKLHPVEFHTILLKYAQDIYPSVWPNLANSAKPI